jgi:integrase
MNKNTKIRDNDGLFEKRGIWQFKVRLGPRRYKQVSTKTRNKNKARKFRFRYLREHEEGKLPTEIAKWPFEQYAEQWQEDQGLRVGKSTREISRFRLKHLVRFFRGCRLCEITAQDIRRYQKERAAQVKNSTVNLETRILRYILKSAKLWSRLADDFENLTVEKFEARVLTPAEEKRLFDLAAKNRAWYVAYQAAIFANNTTVRGCEIRGLQLRDVDLMGRTIKIRRSSTKTDAGVRTIPLNKEAYRAVVRLWQRAQGLGVNKPEHYLLPHQRTDKTFEPTRPQET